MRPDRRGLAVVRAWWLPVVVGTVQLVRLSEALRRPDIRLANTLSDDAFYYVVTAKNFAATGHWTFDGVEPASGFHLLWGYLFEGIYRVWPGVGLHGIYLVGELVECACLVVAAWLAVRMATRLFGVAAQAGVALVILSALMLTLGERMMESSLVIVVSAAMLDLLLRTDGGSTKAQLGYGAALGLLGMLARSDFGLLPLCLLLMHLVLRRRRLSSALMLRLAWFVFGGAAVGAAIVALHTHWISGEWVQSSARQKLWWAQVQGFSSTPVRHLVLSLLDCGYGLERLQGLHRAGAVLARPVAVVLVLGVGALAWKHRRDALAPMLAGLGCTVGAYLWLYRYNSGEMQDWYIANFAVPVALLCGAGLAWLGARAPRAVFGSAAVFCVLGVGSSLQTLRDADSPLWAAGEYVRVHPELRPVGAWNAGAMAYAAGGGITNLDGLVNDRIHSYAVAGTLAEYVSRRGLRTIVDVPVMLDPQMMVQYGEQNLPRRGGYADGVLRACLTAENPSGGPVTGDPDALPALLYHVRPGCGLR